MNMTNLPERFADKVQFGEGCWLWSAYKNKDGYGMYGLNLKSVLAHRYSWTEYNGPIPDGMCILHKCDTPACVNPSHLFLGTSRDNTADRYFKGRSARHIGEKNGRSKLTEDKVSEIRMTYRRGEKGEFSLLGLAKKYGVDKSTIGDIVRGKLWKKFKEEK